MNSGGLKKFETQEEIDEKKKKRQEEWEKVRRPDQPLECPEEIVDHRSLFDRLAEQKQKKEDEYEETNRFSNQVKGLEDDEVAFLDHVSERRSEIEKERAAEERVIQEEMKAGNVVTIEQKTKPLKEKPPMTLSNRKSQNSLLSGAVKRKSTDANDDAKKGKYTDEITCSTTIEDCRGDVGNLNSDHPVIIRPSAHVAIGVLPGIGCYGNSSDSSCSDDSDNDENLQTQAPHKHTIECQCPVPHS